MGGKTEKPNIIFIYIKKTVMQAQIAVHHDVDVANTKYQSTNANVVKSNLLVH